MGKWKLLLGLESHAPQLLSSHWLAALWVTCDQPIKAYYHSLIKLTSNCNRWWSVSIEIMLRCRSKCWRRAVPSSEAWCLILGPQGKISAIKNPPLLFPGSPPPLSTAPHHKLSSASNPHSRSLVPDLTHYLPVSLSQPRPDPNLFIITPHNSSMFFCSCVGHSLSHSLHTLDMKCHLKAQA